MQMKSQPRRKKSPQTPSFEVREHVLLYGVSWEQYERLLEAFDGRRLRHSYLRGTLEIMSPLKLHDEIKKLLARMVEMASFVLDIDIQSIGSTTLRKEADEQGLEPDECYYLANEPRVRHRRDYDPKVDPPPDLAIEVDVTHASIDRFEIYAMLGIPEVWRWSQNKIDFYKLSRGKYRSIKRSSAFPMLRPQDLQTYMKRREEIGERRMIREFAKWLESNKPRS